MKTVTVNEAEYRLPSIQTPFQREVYIHLIKWKWRHIITREPGMDRSGIPYDAILPEAYRDRFPFLYPATVPAVCELKEKFPFRLHIYFNHMASSQAAALNLFLPILLHPKSAQVFRAVRPDFARLAAERLYHGFCVEYWDGVEEEKKGMRRGSKYRGLLNDKSPRAGTDTDIAIAYYNAQGELCLWLIEHKLTEREFTPCGGYKSACKKGLAGCERSFAEIMANKDLCYYHGRCGFNYWKITEDNASFFANNAREACCPFRGGLNQLWRNQLLGLSIEQDPDLPYRHVTFSVVHHPGNRELDRSIESYRSLIAHNPRFTTFTSADLVRAAQGMDDPELDHWARWYGELYKI